MEYKHTLNRDDQAKLDDLYDHLEQSSGQYSGYPASLYFDYSPLFRFLKFHINNIGDPFEDSNFKANTHLIERSVVDYFANLLHANCDYRGYVTNGGTEGNLFGLYLAQITYPTGIIYYSESAHYSVEKIIRLIKADSVKVATVINGEMDYDCLEARISENKHRPVIILLNIGTTMKGAIDNVEVIQQRLNQMGISKRYLHADAALFGAMLPYMTNAPKFGFESGVDSISISGHKFMGSPIPCGVVIAKSQYIERKAARVSYVNIVDSTISGSRNGITPLFLWYAIKRQGTDGFSECVQHCLEVTEHVVSSMHQSGIDAWANPYSNIVVFPKPSAAIINKWQIATYDQIAHLVIMPHHTKSFFDRLIAELKADVVFK